MVREVPEQVSSGELSLSPTCVSREVHNEVSSGTASHPLAWGDRCINGSGSPLGVILCSGEPSLPTCVAEELHKRVTSFLHEERGAQRGLSSGGFGLAHGCGVACLLSGYLSHPLAGREGWMSLLGGLSPRLRGERGARTAVRSPRAITSGSAGRPWSTPRCPTGSRCRCRRYFWSTARRDRCPTSGRTSNRAPQKPNRAYRRRKH
jgi:hypothetical protein